MPSGHDILVRIKRAILAGQFGFSGKAEEEMDRDDLTDLDIAAAILSSVAIYKTIRSTSPWRKQRREFLHVIFGLTLDGRMIYTKGRLDEQDGSDFYYFLISSKRAYQSDFHATLDTLSDVRQQADQEGQADGDA